MERARPAVVMAVAAGAPGADRGRWPGVMLAVAGRWHMILSGGRLPMHRPDRGYLRAAGGCGTCATCCCHTVGFPAVLARPSRRAGIRLAAADRRLCRTLRGRRMVGQVAERPTVHRHSVCWRGGCRRPERGCMATRGGCSAVVALAIRAEIYGFYKTSQPGCVMAWQPRALARLAGRAPPPRLCCC